MSEADAKIEQPVEEAVKPTEPAATATTTTTDAMDAEPTVETKAKSPVNIKKTTAIQSENRQENVKSDASLLPASQDADLIRGQVEFYLSDSNLIVDNHLKEKMQSDKNIPISIAHIHTFKRMRRFQPYSIVVEALRASKVLEVSGAEGEEVVKRKVPFDEAKALLMKEKSDRSVYVKGFGDEDATTQFDIEAFFIKYGFPFKQVRLRRTGLRLFKGSVFVEFEDAETAQKFINLDPKPVYKDCPDLLIMSKADYEAMKAEEIKNGELEPGKSYHNRYNKNNNRQNGRGGNRGGSNRGGRGGRGGNRGRGNGRGGNHQGNRRGPRDNANQTKVQDTKENGVSEAQDTPAPSKNTESTEQSKKRAREDDNAQENAPAKKEKLTEEIKAE